MSTKVYTVALFSLCIFFLGFFFSGSREMEQYSGSESRIGGYLERDFGWNDQQTYFKPVLFVASGSVKEYTRPVDLVVIGDSFSYMESSWIYFLMRKYKVSVLFMHIDKVTVQEVLANEIFINSPPRHVVLQSMEGMAFLRFRRIGSQLKEISKNIAIVDPQLLAPKSPMPEFEAYPIDRIDKLAFRERMAITGDYYLKQMRRRIFGDRSTGAAAIRLDCDSCFSNARTGLFLSEVSNLDTGAYKLMYRKAAIDGLIGMKQAIEANGYTKFHSTVFPNKINVYLGYTGLGSNPTIFEPPINGDYTNFINLLPGLRDAVSLGVRDVYLPNDHHMGSRGFSVAAEIIGEHIYGKSVVTNQPKN